MSRVGNLVLAIEEAICDAMCETIVDDIVVERIAREVGCPVSWVWTSYAEMSEDW